MKNQSLKKNIVLSTIYQILTMVIPLITTPYISRVIGADGIGIYSFTMSIQTYFSMFAALGTASYGAREIARNRNSKEDRSRLFWEIEILSIMTSTICLISWTIFILLNTQYQIYYIILTINLISTMLDISWFYTGLEQFKYTIIQNSIFKIIGVIALFIFVKNPDDLGLYIGIMSLSTLLGTASMWVYLPKFIKKSRIKFKNLLKHFKETLIYFVPTIATSIYTVLDKTLIGTITKNEAENGFYEQATKIINMTKALTFTSLNTVLGSRISYLFAQNKIDEIKSRINKSMNFIFFIGFGIMFGIIGVSKQFVPLFFGQGYDKVINLLMLMSPLIIIIGVSNCLGSQYYSPAGLRSKSSKFIIIGSVVNLILNLILIPKFWSYGATIATIIAESTISILYLLNSNGYMSFGKLFKLGWKKVLSGIIMLILVYLMGIIPLSEYIILIIQIISGIIIYILVLLLLKDNFVCEFIRNLLNKVKVLKKYEINKG